MTAYQRIKRRRARARQIKRRVTCGIVTALIFITGLTLASRADTDQDAEQRSEPVYIEMETTTGTQPESELEENIIETVTAPKELHQYFYIADIPLDAELQQDIAEICDAYHISYTFVLAVIWRESRFDTECIGDNGEAYGLMQIQVKWFSKEMDRLGTTDPMDPVQNVTLGVDLLTRLFEEYEDCGQVLMAYNMGEPTAKEKWTKGIYDTEYVRQILEKQETFEQVREASDK